MYYSTNVKYTAASFLSMVQPSPSSGPDGVGRIDKLRVLVWKSLSFQLIDILQYLCHALNQLM